MHVHTHTQTHTNTHTQTHTHKHTHTHLHRERAGARPGGSELWAKSPIIFSSLNPKPYALEQGTRHNS